MQLILFSWEEIHNSIFSLMMRLFDWFITQKLIHGLKLPKIEYHLVSPGGSFVQWKIIELVFWTSTTT
jgi:hypothetical protein